MKRHLFSLISFAVLLLAGESAVSAQDEADVIVKPALDTLLEVDAAAPVAESQGDRWVLILCGLPGDDDYRDKMTDAIEKLYTTAQPRLGAGTDRIHLLVGDEQMAESLAETTGAVDIATAETVAKLVDQMSTEISPADSLWVFMMGHTDLQGRSSRWNVTDADPDQKTFAKWFQGVQCREKVFWITMPLSGFYVRDLSAPGTVVITGTEPDLEISATEMPYVLADILAGDENSQAAGDRDEDGQTSLLDLYLAVCHEIAERYASENLLLTEHALIDDNGDRRGTELQLRYLPEELGGKPQIKMVRRARSLDGARAAEILLPHLPVAKPAEKSEEKSEEDSESESNPDENETSDETDAV